METINLTPNYRAIYEHLEYHLKAYLNGIRSSSDRQSALHMLEGMREIAIPAIDTATPVWEEN